MAFLVEHGHDRQAVELYSMDEIRMFYRYGRLEERRRQARVDVRLLQCLGSAMALLGGEQGRSVYSGHQSDLLDEVRKLETDADTTPDHNRGS